MRGIAALAVIVFHSQLGIAENGYVGVPVFFALSGFLITSILLAEIQRNGRINLGRFYVNRMLRLWPALVMTCALVIAAAAATGRLAEVGPGSLAVLFYVGNWWMYTGHPAPLLDHTWTLAIEEHFYAIWPVLLVALGSRRRVLRLAALLALAVAVILLFTPWPEPITAVRGTYLRGFPIVWGSVLAGAAARQWGTRRGDLFGTLGSASPLLLLAVLLVPWTLPEHWLTGPSSVTGFLSLCVLTGIVLAPRSWASTALSRAPLRRLYLYHFPILEVMGHHIDAGPEWGRMLIGVAASVAVAEPSFRWLEEPFLRRQVRASSPRVVLT